MERSIRECLNDAEAAFREVLHRHDLDPAARLHLERAVSHTCEAVIAVNEPGHARTVRQLASDMDKVKALVDRLREQQPGQIPSTPKPHRHHV